MTVYTQDFKDEDAFDYLEAHYFNEGYEVYTSDCVTMDDECDYNVGLAEDDVPVTIEGMILESIESGLTFADAWVGDKFAYLSQKVDCDGDVEFIISQVSVEFYNTHIRGKGVVQ